MNSEVVSMEMGEYEPLREWAWWVWTVWMIKNSEDVSMMSMNSVNDYEHWGCEHDE
jgi:hypothetical protein